MISKITIKKVKNGYVLNEFSMENIQTDWVFTGTEPLHAFMNKIFDNEVASATTRKDFPPIYLEPLYPTMLLCTRVRNALKGEKIYYIGDLVGKSAQDLLRSTNLGRKSLNEIIGLLAELGLCLNTPNPDWPPIDLEKQYD